jgi:hypothetical protein
MIKRNGGCLSSSTKKQIPHPRNQTRPRRSPREILQRLPEIHPRQSIQPEDLKNRIFEKIEMKWFTQKEMKKTYTHSANSTKIVKDIIIKTAKTDVHRVAVAHHPTQQNKPQQKNKTKPPAQPLE